jgi:hypothetical protein
MTRMESKHNFKEFPDENEPT